MTTIILGWVIYIPFLLAQGFLTFSLNVGQLIVSETLIFFSNFLNCSEILKVFVKFRVFPKTILQFSLKFLLTEFKLRCDLKSYRFGIYILTSIPVVGQLASAEKEAKPSMPSLTDNEGHDDPSR